MMKFLMVVSIFLAGCAVTVRSPFSKVSLLYGRHGQIDNGNLALLTTGNFAFTADDFSCATVGTWKDMSPGSSVGTISLSVTQNTCGDQSLKEISLNYQLSNGTVIFSN